jgi:hypothetical protein
MDTVVQGVIDKMTVRQTQGFIKYGTTMDRGDLSELEWLVHAQEEAMDTAVYLEKLIQIKKGTTAPPPKPLMAYTPVDGTTLMSFGKFKGRPMDDVPNWYLTWLLANSTNLSDEMKEYIETRIA